MSLSSATSIENAVQRSVSGFSAVDTMGSLVGNREFSQGYCQFACGQETSKSYIWQALSAASQSLGEEVYSNVLHYIDNVANVDVCKVKSLMSMLKLVDSNYLVLDKVQHYPIEIQKLIDILSINKRYLLDNAYIKQSFIDDMVNSGAISDVLSAQQLPGINDISALANGNISSSLAQYVYDQQVFNKYLSSTFYNFMFDMLDMEIVPDDQICAFAESIGSNTSCSPFYKVPYDDMLSYCKAYRQITKYDGYGPQAEHDDKYLQQKKLCNVDIAFDVAAEVDMIELGQTSIGDYHGDELSLIVEEISSRKNALNQINGLSVSSMMARNAYYRKRKVIEYAKFIDSLVGSSPHISAYQTYKYDPSYYLNPEDSIQPSYSLSCDGANVVGIVSADVAKAACNLMAIANYIVKIRQVIRQQVRKVFMKGTNNLLEYAVNEFIIDYANQLTNVFDISQVSAVVSKLSAHSVTNVNVQEYWDHNEYFNISTDTSNRYAYGYKYVNPRYFDEVFDRRPDGTLHPKEVGIFTNAELNEFYLSTLGMKNTLEYPVSSNQLLGSNGLSSNFYDFLSVLFDIAANPSYYDVEHNVFGSQLSNQVITYDIYDDLQTTKAVSAVLVSAAAKAGYEFTSEQTVLEQKDELYSKLVAVLQNEYLSAVSAVYDQYSPQVQSLSAQLDALHAQLSSCLTQQYSSYFCKSDNKYCYDEDTGQYLFEYFVGNKEFDVYDTFITYLDTASQWIQQHCYTYSLSTAISGLSSAYNSVQSNIYELTAGIKSSQKDYVDMHLVNLAEEMDSIKSFLDKKVTLRTAFLQNALENFRSQADQLKTSYDQCVASFQNVLASMPDTSQGYYFQWQKEPSAEYYHARRNQSTKINDSNDQTAEYDQYSQCIFQKISGKPGHWSKESFSPSNDITETGTLKANVINAINRLEECQHIYYGFIGGPDSPSTTTSRSYGSQKEALNAILMTLNDITEQHNSVINSVNDLFSIDSAAFNDISIGGENAGKDKDQDIHEKILKLQAYLATEITDVDFANDKQMKDLNGYLLSVANISASYIPAQESYEEIWSDFSTFLADYNKSGDFKTLKPDNLQKLDIYRADKDNKALNEINASLSKLRASYDGIVSQFIDICKQGVELYITPYIKTVYEYTSNALEHCLDDFTARLLRDVQVKTSVGNKKVDDDWQIVIDAIDTIANGERTSGKVGLYRKYFPDELVPLTASYSQYETEFDAQHIAFTDILQKLLDKLDYTREQSFDEQRLMFQNYTGITTSTLSADKLIAADPYYNYKNQTHPSYQIHPFLWKFSENAIIKKAIDTIASIYANIDVDELEGSLIQGSLDKYIGQFGNVIDVWKTHARDFTSYTTRYEQSDHICRYTNVSSEVVDYDGAFYPPALSAYRNSSNYESVSAWYAHLSVDYDQQMFARIKSCLSQNRTPIFNITNNKALDKVDDIFKYQLDTYGNMYILYKRYTSQDVPYAEKLSAVGQLWIRLADSPLAFPLSSIVDVSKCARDYDQNIGSQDNSSISAWPICDFEIVPSGNKICIAYKDTKTKLTKCIALDIQYDMLNGCGVGDLKLVASETQALPFPKELAVQSEEQLSDGKCTAVHYLGMYPRSVTEVGVAYIDAIGISSSVAVELSCIADHPYVHIYQVFAEMDSQRPSSIDARAEVSNVIGLGASIAYYDSQDGNGHLDISFAAKTVDDSVDVHRVEQPSISVDLVERPDGYVYSDPMHASMNSFDVFNQTLQVATVDYADKAHAHLMPCQTNADMGYTPSYAGLSVAGPLSVIDEMKVSHQAIELLGKSKDLDKLASLVNPEPNPYMTRDEISSKYLFGRIWQNGAGELSSQQFSDALDKSLDIVQNMSFYQNMPEMHQDIGGTRFMAQRYVQSGNESYFLQTMQLRAKYQLSDLQCLKVIMYGTQALGRSMYIVEDLSSMAQKSGGSQYVPVNYDYGVQHNDDISVLVDGGFVKVAGTYNGIDEADSNALNTFQNISAISYLYDSASGQLNIKYTLEDPEKPTFIEPGVVRIALVNIYDIRFMEWFHLMDTGASYKEGIIQELNNITKTTPIAPSAMLAVDLGSYTALSDVQAEDISSKSQHILDTWNKMMFKVDEEDLFPVSSFNYYVPSINIKYPLTFGQAFVKAYIPDGLSADSMVKVFKPDELYVIDAQDASEVSTVGDVPFNAYSYGADDELRVFEDYLSSDNASKYCIDDPNFYQYAHFFGTSVPAAGEMSTGIEVPPSAIDNVQVQLAHDDESSSDRFSQFASSVHLSAMASEIGSGEDEAPCKLVWKSLASSQRSLLLAKISKLLRLYFNYKKTSDGIVLYVNYQNYLNTPFVKLVDGKVYADTVSGTYARIKPNEHEDLAIVVQFRMYAGNALVSVKNVTAATYRVHNLSDDKPKFLLRKMSGPGLEDVTLDNAITITADQRDAASSSTPYMLKAASKLPLDTTLSCVVGYVADAVECTGGIPMSSGTFMATFSRRQPTCNVTFSLKTSQRQRYLGKKLPVDIIDVQADTAREVIAENGYVRFTQ